MKPVSRSGAPAFPWARRLRPLAALLSGLALAACGGAGGPGPAALGFNPAAVAPAPLPVSPTINFDTPEYRRSTAAVQSRAIAAWTTGATGQGVTIGFVDSGIASGSPEFAGRIAAASRDVSGLGRSIVDTSGHGTAVAAVAAAARNDAGPMGIAFQATLAVMRADNGQCEDGCSYSDAAIARGIDAAVAAGARVVNLSLGGSSANPALRAAFARATSQGVVLVLSAGNDSLAQPGLLPQGALSAAGPSAVIIAGSINANGEISEFSNRAGSASANFLVTIGEAVRSFDHTGQAFLYSGTSFAAPTVSGAVALLSQAFPTLSAARIAEILLTSADDLGAPGPDPVYGRGRLNIGRAIAPIGPTSLAGTAIPVSSAPNGSLGSAFGNGMSTGAGLAAIPVTDRFDRAYTLSLGGTLRPASPSRLGARLAAAGLETQATSLAEGPLVASLALRASPFRDRGATDAFRATDRGTAHLGLAQRGVDRHMGMRNPLRETRLQLRSGRFGFTVASGLLAAEALPGAARPGFVAEDGLAPDEGTGTRGRQLAMADWSQGPLTVALAATHRSVPLPATFGLSQTAQQDRLMLAAGLALGPVRLAMHAAITDEDGALLGTRLGPGFGLLGGRSSMIGAAVDLGQAGFGLRLAGTQGWSNPWLAGDALFQSASTLHSRSWSASAFAPLAGGTLSARIAQPLGITGGQFRLATGASLDAAARAHERAVELGYARGAFSLALFHRSQAGHMPGLSDRGGALTWSSGF